MKIQGLLLSGSGGEVELTGLPFRGSVPVRKKSMLSGHWTWPFWPYHWGHAGGVSQEGALDAKASRTSL